MIFLKEVFFLTFRSSLSKYQEIFEKLASFQRGCTRVMLWGNFHFIFSVRYWDKKGSGAHATVLCPVLISRGTISFSPPYSVARGWQCSQAPHGLSLICSPHPSCLHNTSSRFLCDKHRTHNGIVFV